MDCKPLDIGFNDPDNLKARLDDTLRGPRFRVDPSRFVVGSQGGLAYKLFTEGLAFPPAGKLTRESLLRVGRYQQTITNYLDFAEEIAEANNFYLALVKNGVITPVCGPYDIITDLGIGHVNINSADKLFSLLGLVDKHRDSLEHYQGHISGISRSEERRVGKECRL